MVEEAAASGTAFGQGPACGVYHQALLVLLGRNFPEFFDADAVVLWLFAGVQVELGDQLLAQLAATAFAEQGVLGVQLHARHVGVFLLAVHADTHIACGDTFDAAVFVVKDFSGGETGEDFYAQGFGLFTQPAAHVAQA